MSNPNQFNSALAVKGPLDIFRDATTGWDAQFRFYSNISNGNATIRHIITDDHTTNDLIIIPGYQNNASNILQLQGNEQITRGLDLIQPQPNTGNPQYNIIGFRNGTAAAQEQIYNNGNNLIVDLNPNGTGNPNSLLEIEGNEQVTGTVRIGNTQLGSSLPNAQFTNYQLSVDGQIATKEVVVQTNSWADTVFSNSYKLKNLSALEDYIQANHHLPGVPAEKDVVQNGISLGEMDKILLQKVEELTLYALNLQQRLKKLETKK